MDMIALGAAAISAALCAVVVRQKAPEISIVLAMGACILLLWNILPALQNIRDVMRLLANFAELSEGMLKPVLQTVGLAIVTKLASALCKDAGESGVAAFVELAGGTAAVVVSLPLLKMVLECMAGLL